MTEELINELRDTSWKWRKSFNEFEAQNNEVWEILFFTMALRQGVMTYCHRNIKCKSHKKILNYNHAERCMDFQHEEGKRLLQRWKSFLTGSFLWDDDLNYGYNYEKAKNKFEETVLRKER